jgi:hypothetical protein
MAIRERLKKTFSRNSASGAGSQDSGNPESNVYKPGEKMPQSKYRRPVAKEHKEKLEAFSFADAWRRRSHASTYSPMGSRMPSRKNSAEPQVGRKSRSFVQHSAEKKEADNADVANGQRFTYPYTYSAHTNMHVVVGLSRQPTADGPPSSQKQGDGPLPPPQAIDFANPQSETPPTNDVRHDTPFASDELVQKLSHLVAPSAS